MCVIIVSFADNDTWEEIQEFIDENYKWFKSFLQMIGNAPNFIYCLIDVKMTSYI